MTAPQVCFYFQVHQPYRLRDVRIHELHNPNVQYFDEVANRAIFRKVAQKCYLPTNALLLEMIKREPNFKIAFSLSGVFMEQCLEYGPDVLESFQKLAATGNVEFLAETYYHSLSSIVSTEEFCQQIKQHSMLTKKLFKQTPKVFRNTELIYNNHIANLIAQMGFKGMITEGTDRHLAGRNPNNLYQPYRFELDTETKKIIKKYAIAKKPSSDFSILLKNYKLSDDIAFRFSNQAWEEYPLTSEKFTDWLQHSAGHTINLFMDYETFGEHQWEASGIFRFLESLPYAWSAAGVTTALPSEVIANWNPEWQKDVYDIHETISWADSERDLSAWQGNRIQDTALQSIFALRDAILATNDPERISTWRKLLTSDHFYYMCTKFWADGDVHKYFSPYDSPYEAYRRFRHVIEHLRTHVPTSTSR
jgi:alpha-amylase